jgi:hypothetical protein
VFRVFLSSVMILKGFSLRQVFCGDSAFGAYIVSGG